jgi:DNA-binding IclR family transcriptional regulator
MPIVKALSDRFNETCYVCARRGDSAVLIAGVASTQPTRCVVELNQPFPLCAGAVGRAILSGLPDDQIDEVLGRTQLVPVTANTITDPDRLHDEFS